MENQGTRENQRATGGRAIGVSGPAVYNYRNLDLWKRAQELALEVIRLSEALPSTPAGVTLARQVVRSAASIGANIAEGHGRYSMAAYRNHLSIGKGSAAETDSWVDLLRRAGHIDSATEERLHQQCLTIMGALTRRMRALDAKMQEMKDARVREVGFAYEYGREPATEASE
jgi:four helix bundle protein